MRIERSINVLSVAGGDLAYLPRRKGSGVGRSPSQHSPVEPKSIKNGAKSALHCSADCTQFFLWTFSILCWLGTVFCAETAPYDSAVNCGKSDMTALKLRIYSEKSITLLSRSAANCGMAAVLLRQIFFGQCIHPNP